MRLLTSAAVCGGYRSYTLFRGHRFRTIRQRLLLRYFTRHKRYSVLHSAQTEKPQVNYFLIALAMTAASMLLSIVYLSAIFTYVSILAILILPLALPITVFLTLPFSD